jgi:hypothetical protein
LNDEQTDGAVRGRLTDVSARVSQSVVLLSLIDSSACSISFRKVRLIGIWHQPDGVSRRNAETVSLLRANAGEGH